MNVDSSFAVKCLLLMSWAQCAFSAKIVTMCDQDFCNIEIANPAGPIENFSNKFSNDVDHELIFQRQGGVKCKCSYVSCFRD